MTYLRKMKPHQLLDQYLYILNVENGLIKLKKNRIYSFKELSIEEAKSIISSESWIANEQFISFLVEETDISKSRTCIKRKIPEYLKQLVFETYSLFILALFEFDDRNYKQSELISKVAVFFHKASKLIIVKEINEMRIYNKVTGVYESAEKVLPQIIAIFLENFLTVSWNSNTINEIILRIKAKTAIVNWNEFDVQGFAFANKTLLLNTMEPYFVNHSPNFYLTKKSTVHVDETANCPMFYHFLEEIIPDEIKFIQEYGGYMLDQTNRAQKLLIAFGGGRNGKSVLFDVFTQIIGVENSASASMDELSSRFGKEVMLNKKVNISNEGATFSYNPDTLKALVSGDPLNVDRKNKPAITTSLYAKHVFITNKLPPIYDQSFGYKRRLLLLKFMKQVSETKVDPFLTEKLLQESSGILNFLVKGLTRLRQNKYHFSESEGMLQAKRNYFNSANPLSSFISKKIEIRVGKRLYRNEVINCYQEWLVSNSLYDRVATNTQLFWKKFEEEYYDQFDHLPIVKKNKQGRFIENVMFKTS